MAKVLAVVLALLLAALTADTALAAGDPLRARQWNLSLIESDAAHATSTGAGATVAIVDSGVALDHPDLAGRLVAGHDFVDGDATPQDGDGHGTHVTGIIGAATGNGVGIASVAPRARLMPVRVLGDDGSGEVDAIAAGIDWARTHGADVINLSLGSEVPIVGAVDKRAVRSVFSSFGSGLGIVAPGGSALPATDENVLSTVPGGYVEMAGTSQAAPHVSGVAALLVSLGLRGQAAVDRMLATATDLGPPGVDAQYGHGLVDARAAVAGLMPKPFVHVKRARHAVKISMRAAATGRAHIRVTTHGNTVARAARSLRAGRARTVKVRLKRHTPYKATVRVRLPGEQHARVRHVKIRR